MSRPRFRSLIFSMGLLASLVCSVASELYANEPLHLRIDQLVDQTTVAPTATTVSDLEFIRRVSIDLTGMPPSVMDLESFLADENPDKRAALVDRLLASPEYVRHLTTSLDIMLMERRRNQHVKQDEWLGWLHKSVSQNKPWNQLAKEILASDGVDPNLRAPVRFYLDRGSEPNLLTRDVARIFFGRDLQCAQCHDHPIIDDYKQADYHGLYAFLAGGYEYKSKDKKSYFAEKAGGAEIFSSVFLPDFESETAPKLPLGPEIEEPKFYPGDEYTKRPAKPGHRILKYSRRAKLAELAASGNNRAFNENIANRLWAHMMGRGLVHPIDLHHTVNPPSHPALLKLLGEEIAGMDFDMRAFLREIALSKVYQRSIDLPSDLVVKSKSYADQLSKLEQEVSTFQGKTEAADDLHAQQAAAWNEAVETLKPVKKELRDARKKATELKKPYDAANKALADARAKLKPQLDLIAKYRAILVPADQALNVLEGDEELEQAIAPIKAKIDALEKKAAPLRKAVADQEAALQKPEAALQAQWKVIDEIRVRIKPLEETAFAKQAEVAKSRQVSLDLWNELSRRTAQLESAKQFVDYGPAESIAIAATQKHNQTVQQYRQATDAVEQYSKQFQEKQKVWQTVSKQHQQVSQQLAAAENDLQNLPTAVKNMAAVRENIADAMASLNSEAELAQLVGVFETKAEVYQSKLNVAEKTATEMASRLKEIQPVYELAKQEFASAEAEMQTKLKLKNQFSQKMQSTKTEADQTADVSEALRQELTKDWSSQFAVAPLKPMMPEQFAWSILQVTGVRERTLASVRAELEKKKPLSDDDKKNPEIVAQREAEIEELTYQKLNGSVQAFVNVYSAGDGQNQYDFFATVDQALFAANGGSIISWVNPSSGNVTQRMLQSDDLAAAANDLYLSYLTRPPTADETKAVVEYIQSRPEEKQACITEIAWALLNSAEFRFNH